MSRRLRRETSTRTTASARCSRTSLVAIRCRTSLDGCEQERRGNRESFLRSPEEMVERFAGIDRVAAERTGTLAERLEFDLTQELGYRYPDFSDGPIRDPAARRGLRRTPSTERYSGRNGHRAACARAPRDELALIDELGLAGFFLLHWEVLELAREVALEVRGRDSPRTFLPPGRGRGSSVGSIVCYLTGLSHVDPVEHDLSLGRFLNRELASVPDIDLDFPRDIREKLIVARHRALRARARRARRQLRHLPLARRDPRRRQGARAAACGARAARARHRRLERGAGGGGGRRAARRRARSSPRARWRAFQMLTGEIAGLPRHVSQHPGGMVISSRPLVELVPVQPAAMAGRQLCQWDKDSCADAGFLKIDLLGLGMLSCVEDCVDRIARAATARRSTSRGSRSTTRPCSPRSRGRTRSATFQIESRAQMQSLLRTRPETIDDLTVQVALVRPGPIQGKAVHPYIEHRRRLREDPSYVPPVDHELLARAAARDARRRRLPGPGARRRDRARRASR